MIAAIPVANLSLYVELPLLIVLISLVYSATRFDQWDAILRETFRWVLRMMLFLVGIVLILCGISLEETAMTLRVILAVCGIGLEAALLFIK